MRAWRSLAAAMVLAAGVAGWLPAAVAVGPDYRIGTDDVLAISVWDQKDLDQTVSVRPDGKISLPLVGEVEAGGLTVAELASRLTTLYARTVRAAQVTVSVREIRSRPVYFVGSVARPGQIQLTQEMTVLQALSSVGGATPMADLEGAFVMRGQTRIPVNIQTLQRGETAQNIRLQPGDTVVVPNADSVYVQGEVKAPGPVKYAKGMTVVQAIAAAGGFTPVASARRVTVVRGDAAKKQVLKVNVNDIMSDPDARDVSLQPNDVITVPQRLF
jgi:polysaccharide export outer membrane protein